jgi:hypothetical protein
MALVSSSVAAAAGHGQVSEVSVDAPPVSSLSGEHFAALQAFHQVLGGWTLR